MGVFGSVRYYRLFARVRMQPRSVLIADSLRGSEMTEEIRQLVIHHLQQPGLAVAGAQAHLAREEEP
jgi:hypothetical protein